MNREKLQGPSLPTSFGFEKEHELLRSQARRLLAERFDLRAFYDKPTSYRELYKELASLGWLATESWLATALLLEEIGRVLLPLPIAPALLAAQALPPDEREAVTSGEKLATVALDTEGPEFRGVPWIESGLFVAPS
ncbi:MAG TPA: hypothetical protein VFB62_02920, partial [Polyangiaceae bacterium]|nr:hypothetical protein [Polyangiaceae bacterium]